MLRSAVTLGPVVACGAFRIRELRYPPGYRQPLHAHPTANLTLVLAGSIRESCAGREEIGSALSLVIKPAGVRHCDEVGPRGAVTLQLALDFRQAEGWTAGNGNLSRWHWIHGRPPAAAMVSLLRALRGPPPAPPWTLADRILDVLGAVPDEDPTLGEPPVWLRRVKEALDDALPRNVTISELACAAGAHPVSVSRASAGTSAAASPSTAGASGSAGRRSTSRNRASPCPG